MKLETQPWTPGLEGAQPPKLPPSPTSPLNAALLAMAEAKALLAAEAEDQRAELEAAQAAARADRAAARAAEKAARLEARSVAQAEATEALRLRRLAECFVGQRFGSLVVEAPFGQDASGRRLVDAKCDCGRRLLVLARALPTGAATCCEWCAHRAEDEAKAGATPPDSLAPDTTPPHETNPALDRAKASLVKNRAILKQAVRPEREVEEKARAFSRFHNAEPDEVPAASAALREVLARQEAAKTKRLKARQSAKCAIRYATKVIRAHEPTFRLPKPTPQKKPESAFARAQASLKKNQAVLKQPVDSPQDIEDRARAYSAMHNATPEEAFAKGAALRELLARQAILKADRRRNRRAAQKAIRYAQKIIQASNQKAPNT